MKKLLKLMILSITLIIGVNTNVFGQEIEQKVGPWDHTAWFRFTGDIPAGAEYYVLFWLASGPTETYPLGHPVTGRRPCVPEEARGCYIGEGDHLVTIHYNVWDGDGIPQYGNLPIHVPKHGCTHNFGQSPWHEPVLADPEPPIGNQ